MTKSNWNDSVLAKKSICLGCEHKGSDFEVRGEVLWDCDVLANSGYFLSIFNNRAIPIACPFSAEHAVLQEK